MKAAQKASIEQMEKLLDKGKCSEHLNKIMDERTASYLVRSGHPWPTCELKNFEHEKDNADLDKLSQTKQNLSNEVDQLRKISETLPEWCTSS